MCLVKWKRERNDNDHQTYYHDHITTIIIIVTKRGTSLIVMRKSVRHMSWNFLWQCEAHLQRRLRSVAMMKLEVLACEWVTHQSTAHNSILNWIGMWIRRCGLVLVAESSQRSATLLGFWFMIMIVMRIFYLDIFLVAITRIHNI